MKKEYKIINAHIFIPDKSMFRDLRNDKSSCSIIECCNSENCDLYKRGECSWMGSIGYNRCPYGKYSEETGFTSRAKKYRDWVSKREDKYKNNLDKLKSHSNMVAEVGEYIFLPYSNIDMNKDIPFIDHSTIVSKGISFVPKEFFTIQNIINICEFIPKSMSGREIDKYQKEVVPKFLQHLSEQMPKIYNELCLEYERAIEIVSSISNVGRKAQLSTLTPNVGEFVDVHGGVWKWDGEYLTSYNSHASFVLVNNFSKIKIIPSAQSTAKITDEDQFNKDTVFFT